MTTQFQQVVRLYLTNRQVWWIVGWMALMSLPAISIFFSAGLDNRAGFAAMQLIAFPVGGCIFLLNSQAKWQFCNPRARLTPNYAAPHLAVLAVVMIAFVGLLPLIASLAGYNPLGAMACAATLAAPFLWASHANWPLANLLAMGLFFSLYNNRVAAFWLGSDDAARWLPFHLALLVAGWLALIAWLWRLAQLREDAPDYGLPVNSHVGSATRTERTQASRAVMLQLLRSPPTRWICDRWHNRLTGFRASSTGARRRLLRYGFAAMPVVASAAWVALIFFATIWIMSQSAVFHRADSQAAILPALNIMMIMPAMTTFGMLIGRRPRMAQELLLPLSRGQYIDGLLVASGRSAAVAWLTVHAALLALLAVVAPSLLAWPFVVALTALSLSAQLYSFGVMTRVTQISQGGKRIVMLMVALIPAMFALAAGLHCLEGPETSRAELNRRTQEQIASLTANLNPEQRAGAEYEKFVERQTERLQRQAETRWVRQQPRSVVTWTIAAGMAAVGVAVAYNGRRRWLELELG